MNELVRMRDLGRLDDLRQGETRIPAADIVGHRIVEHQVVLHDHADLRAQGIERHPAEVVTV